MATPFKRIYDSFFNKITDDMYMELTADETADLVRDIMFSALPSFEFPRVNIFDYSIELEEFNAELSMEEINIIATYMVVEWIGQQLASVENTRMKYSGSDFKFTSQANHMAKLQNLKEHYRTQGFHLQRLYKRRRPDKNGIMRSTLKDIMKVSVE